MRYRRMTEIYGKNELYKCGECARLKRISVGKRNIYKCELWMKLTNAGSSSATDIRLKDTACRMFKFMD